VPQPKLVGGDVVTKFLKCFAQSEAQPQFKHEVGLCL